MRLIATRRRRGQPSAPDIMEGLNDQPVAVAPAAPRNLAESLADAIASCNELLRDSHLLDNATIKATRESRDALVARLLEVQPQS